MSSPVATPSPSGGTPPSLLTTDDNDTLIGHLNSELWDQVRPILDTTAGDVKSMWRRREQAIERHLEVMNRCWKVIESRRKVAIMLLMDARRQEKETGEHIVRTFRLKEVPGAWDAKGALEPDSIRRLQGDLDKFGTLARATSSRQSSPAHGTTCPSLPSVQTLPLSQTRQPCINDDLRGVSSAAAPFVAGSAVSQALDDRSITVAGDQDIERDIRRFGRGTLTGGGLKRTAADAPEPHIGGTKRAKINFGCELPFKAVPDIVKDSFEELYRLHQRHPKVVSHCRKALKCLEQVLGDPVCDLMLMQALTIAACPVKAVSSTGNAPATETLPVAYLLIQILWLLKPEYWVHEEGSPDNDTEPVARIAEMSAIIGRQGIFTKPKLIDLGWIESPQARIRSCKLKPLEELEQLRSELLVLMKDPKEFITRILGSDEWVDKCEFIIRTDGE